MAHYKDLNKELVDQVQTMRIRLQEFGQEIISLRATCMHKHENIVFLRKKCKDFALLHFQQYLEFLEPDSSMLSVIQGVQQNSLSPPTTSLQNANIHQSARLTVECRRSSSLTQTRRSFNSTSPIRSSSCNEVQLEEDDILDAEFQSSVVLSRNAIIEEDEENGEDENTVEETGNCLDTTNTLGQGESVELETESNKSHKGTNDVDTVERRTRTFRDITNTLSPTNTLCKITVKEIRNTSNEHKTRRKEPPVSRNKTTKSTIEDYENEYPNIVSPTVSSSPIRKTNHVTLSRGRWERKKHADKPCGPEENEIAHKILSEHQIWLAQQRAARFGDSDDSLLQDSNSEFCQQESIQEVRKMTRGTHETAQPFSTPGEEVADSSYALSENTLSQFKGATSSTPIQQLRNIPPSSKPESTPGHSSRPKRSCRPKSMVEPSLSAKMRNESGEKSLISRSNYYKRHT